MKAHTRKAVIEREREREPTSAFYPFILCSQFIQELEKFGCTFGYVIDIFFSLSSSSSASSLNVASLVLIGMWLCAHKLFCKLVYLSVQFSILSLCLLVFPFSSLFPPCFWFSGAHFVYLSFHLPLSPHLTHFIEPIAYNLSWCIFSKIHQNFGTSVYLRALSNQQTRTWTQQNNNMCNIHHKYY